MSTSRADPPLVLCPYLHPCLWFRLNLGIFLLAMYENSHAFKKRGRFYGPQKAPRPYNLSPLDQHPTDLGHLVDLDLVGHDTSHFDPTAQMPPGNVRLGPPKRYGFDVKNHMKAKVVEVKLFSGMTHQQTARCAPGFTWCDSVHRT